MQNVYNVQFGIVQKNGTVIFSKKLQTSSTISQRVKVCIILLNIINRMRFNLQQQIHDIVNWSFKQEGLSSNHANTNKELTASRCNNASNVILCYYSNCVVTQLVLKHAFIACHFCYELCNTQFQCYYHALTSLLQYLLRLIAIYFSWQMRGRNFLSTCKNGNKFVDL